jgi:RNA polymerase sigma factor (sigma-70 family)
VAGSAVLAMTATPFGEDTQKVPISTPPTTSREKIACVRGDFQRFFYEEYDGLVRFVMRCGANLADAEDAAQDAFADAWKHMKTSMSWGAIENPQAWIRKVALRKLWRPAGSSRRQPLTSSVPVPPEPSTHGADLAELTAGTMRVLDAMRSLDATARAVMSFHLDGFKGPEIASQLGITPQQARDALKRARRDLARKLDGPSKIGGGPEE